MFACLCVRQCLPPILVLSALSLTFFEPLFFYYPKMYSIASALQDFCDVYSCSRQEIVSMFSVLKQHGFMTLQFL
jgi:hypothetical protein